MKKERIIIFFAIVILATALFASFLSLIQASSSGISIIQADVLAEEVSIQVPDIIYLPDLAKGYCPRVGVENKQTINNTGNVPIKVIPIMINETELITNDTVLLSTGSAECDEMTLVNSFSLDIDAHKELGGEPGDKDFYITVDLRTYNGNINEERTEQAEIQFIATKQ
jgi:hypothetical protein